MSKKHVVLNSFQDMNLHSRNPNRFFMIGEAISLQVEAVAVTDVEMESPLKAELEVVAGIEVVVGIKAAIEIEGKELHFHACMGKFQAP